MITLPPLRPEGAIERLTQVLEPISTDMDVIPRKRILWESMGVPQWYLLKEGELSIVRVSDGLLIATAYDQNIFGIGEFMQPMRSHYLRAGNNCHIMRMDANRAFQIISECGLWQDVSAVLAYYTGYLFYRDALLVQQRNYSVVRAHLLELIKLPVETRMNVTMLEYIQERTHLSRTSILGVLTALKNGSYINYQRGGYLLEVMNLPHKF